MDEAVQIFKIRKPSKGSAYFISGTGTGIGKTRAAAFIAKSLIQKGFRVAVMKPVQTGLSDGESDISAINRLCPGLVPIDESLACPYSFNLSASPHLAAKCENRKINAAKILNCFAKIRREYPDAIVLVEGAGGLMVPIFKNYMMTDLIKDMNIPTILAASVSLGTINHTLLSVEALKKRQIKIEGIAFSNFPNNPDLIEKDNVSVISKLSGVGNIGIIPRIRKYSLKDAVQ
jgi:dethiobiotin synthetase